MSDFLDQACRAARERVSRARADVPDAVVEQRAQERPVGVSLAGALRGPGVAVVAEIKRSSPSRGAIAAIPDPGRLAAAYVAGGAAAVSVLTEPFWFSGSLEDLAQVRQAVTVPVLRKDFVVDSYQIWEARAAGAAAVLLIVAALPAAELKALLAASGEAALEALVEVHTRDEAAAALDALEAAGVRRPVVGVNARDLATLEVDPGRFEEIRGILPADALAVAESGVAGPADVRRLAGLGAHAVLVGEHVAGAAEPAAAVAALVEAGRP